MHVAVLDLGTNTFNLIVARKTGKGKFQIVHNSKQPVKLGEGGINEGRIADTAFSRGINAIEKHYQTIQHFEAGRILAFGTSALRSAENGPDFLSQIKKLTNIDIQVISGDREAELIYLGVRQTYPMKNQPCLLLDIGGGSNELIIANGKEIFWKKSYNLGIARLLEKFTPSDPITLHEINSIREYLDEQLQDLFQAIKEYRITTLLGASGSFETFVSMIAGNEILNETESALEAHAVPVLLTDFNLLYTKLIESTLAERMKMPGLETMRVEMIVLASLFVKFIVEKTGITEIIQSNFALKEGAIYELINAD